MKVLGLDTASSIASVAVVDGDRVLAEMRSETAGHRADLLVLVDAVCQRAGVMPLELDAIAIGAGPGSFTGLRIGMATAKGIAFAAKRPLWAVSSLAALAHAAGRGDELVVAVLDARRGEVYAAMYRGNMLVGVERVMPPAELVAIVTAERGGTTAREASGTAREASGTAREASGTAREASGTAREASGTAREASGTAREASGTAREASGTAREASGTAREASGTRVHVIGDASYPELATLDGTWGQTPSGASVALLALAGARIDVLLHGAPSYIRPSEAEIKYPDGVPGALRKR